MLDIYTVSFFGHRRIPEYVKPLPTLTTKAPSACATAIWPTSTRCAFFTDGSAANADNFLVAGESFSYVQLNQATIAWFSVYKKTAPSKDAVICQRRGMDL